MGFRIDVTLNYEYIILDPFLGTGTTQAAAAAVCCNSIGVEKDASLKNFGTQINFDIHSFFCTALLWGSKRLWFLLLGILR